MMTIGTSFLSRLAVLLLAIGATTTVRGQSRDADCMSMVREAYGALRGFSTSTKTCRAQYTVRTVANAGGKSRASVSKISLTANRDRVHVVSETMEIYRDRASAFVVVPATRTIYISDPASDAAQDRRALDVAMFQDSILDYAHVVECSAVADPSLGADRRVVLGLPPGMMRSLGLSRIVLLMNSAGKSIRRITIDYSGRSVSSVEVTVDSFDYSDGGSDFARPVSSLIYAKPGTLLPRYNGYTVIDVRNRKR